MGNNHMFSICVEPAFDGVVDVADDIAQKCGMSRSIVMRTILHEFFGALPANEYIHKARMQTIEEALGRK
jgi:hypothetical protein